MKLDDLLGLLFLIFFVILPAIQGVMKRGSPPGEAEADRPPPPRPQPQQPTPRAPAPSAAPAKTAAPPASTRPSPAAPKPTTPSKPVQQTLSQKQQKQDAKKTRTLEDIERERLSRSGSKPAQPQPQARVVPPPTMPAVADENWTFSAEPRAILNGVIWNQVLSEPRSKYWRNRRKPKP